MPNWSMPTSPAGRWTISSDSISHLCCGASCPGPVRLAVCSRLPCVLSATARTKSRCSSRRNTGLWRRTCARQTGQTSRRASTRWTAKTLKKFTLGDKGEADKALEAVRTGGYSVQLGRSKAGQAQPGPALHHLHAAAGSLPQAGLYGQAHHAGRAEALRRRPHHLYAYRRRQHGRGSLCRLPVP